MILAGCTSKSQAWILLPVAIAYTAIGVWGLVRRPESGVPGWPPWANRLGKIGIIGIGCAFVVILLIIALTGNNPGISC